MTSYGYGQDGALGSVDYSDSTPDIAYAYHRLGQVAEVRDGTLASGAIADTDLRYRHHYSLTPELRPDTETIHTGGTFTLQRHYESTAPNQVPGRYQGYTLSSSSEASSASVSSVTQSVSYSYSPSTGRLEKVTSDAGTFPYGYLPHAGLIETVTGPVHTVYNTYQPFGYGLKSKTNKVGATVVSKFEYRLNDLGQRTAMVTTGTAFAQSMQYQYRYNEKGEVIAGDRYQGTDLLNPGPAIPADTFAYTFDDIGNRRTATRAQDPETQNPDPETRNPKLETYTANLLNQYTQIATSSASVPPVVQSVAPEHDADGNLVSDARWTYTWSAENRLIEMETAPTAVAAGTPKQKLIFTYDYQGRRVSKNVYSWNLALETWHLERGTRFLYDGWNLLAEFSLQDSALQPSRSYVWGIDLSGALQGAGGVGGLLQVSAFSPSALSTFPCFDANGNVSEYLDATGAPAAHFEYSPFGQTLRSEISNPQISDLPYRFSTKYTDSETALLYYGFRYYNPSTGRWLSRDPIEENGGVNLYGFVVNDPISLIDLNGLALYAFDGTGQTYESRTNVRALYDVYAGTAFYHPGVGSQWGTKIIGGVTGAGGSSALESAYRQFLRAVHDGDGYVDIVGFSRGASLAREFANLIVERGYQESVTSTSVVTHRGNRRVVFQTENFGKKPDDCTIVIRFVGLFDTVGSFGIPGNSINWGIRMNLPPSVLNAAQATSLDEKRFLFPLTPLNPAAPGQNFVEKGFRGDHSDVGGRANDANNDLTRAALEWMWTQGVQAGAPFGPLPAYTPSGRTTPNNDSVKFPWNLFPQRPR